MGADLLVLFKLLLNLIQKKKDSQSRNKIYSNKT